MANLLVIAGPIAAGKSSLARVIGDRAGDTGNVVAEIDLDDVARMGRGPEQSALWESAHEPFAALVGGWLRAPVDLVIAHGSIYTPDQVGALRRAAPHARTACR